jgi:sorbitol-specific phosphotransferase system component IIBC
MALGAAVAAMVGGIPLIGPLLQPLAVLIGALYGAGIGAAIENGDHSGSPLSAAIALADKFFELLKNILNSVAAYLSGN